MVAVSQAPLAVLQWCESEKYQPDRLWRNPRNSRCTGQAAIGTINCLISRLRAKPSRS